MNIKYLKSGIYEIVNLVNNKRYIGQAENLIKRKNEHFNTKKSNIPLQRAMKKYGKENFEFIVLEYVEPIKEKLDTAEQRYLDFYKDRWDRLYNISPTASSCLGVKYSDEVRAKHRNIVFNQEAIEKMRSANLGRRHSMETRKKLSDLHKGRIISEETRKKLSDSRKGRIVSEETRKKISKNKKGIKYSLEQRENVRKGILNRTDEQKEKHRLSVIEAHKGKTTSEETKKKMSEAHKGKIRPTSHIENNIQSRMAGYEKNKPDGTIGVKELSEKYNIDYKKAQKMLSNRKFDVIKVGQRVWAVEDSVREYLKNLN